MIYLLFNLRRMLFFLMLLLVACGSNNDERQKNTIPLQISSSRSNGHLTYSATLLPVNHKISGEGIGVINININDDDIVVDSEMNGTYPGVKHFQLVMNGKSCPSTEFDLNGDGVVDIREGEGSWGKVLLPLDSDLSEQYAGMDFGPISNASGNYFYRRSSKISLILNDLYLPDPDEFDDLLKLFPGEELEFDQKVVLILGLPSSLFATPTIARLSNGTLSESVPIACGVLKKQTDLI